MRPYLLSLGVPLLIILSVNRLVNLGGLGEHAAVLEIASSQQIDQLMVAESGFDQRAWLKARLSKGCPDVLLVGSSTMGALREEWMRGLTLVNGWLGGGLTPEDYEAIASVLQERSCTPRFIIIGADLWSIGNSNFTDQRWITWYDDYARYHGNDFVRTAYRARVSWSRFTELLNFVTTRESFRRLLFSADHGLKAQTPAELVALTPEAFCATITREYYIRSYDGHYTDCPSWLHTPKEIEHISENYLADNTHGIMSWKSVDEHRVEEIAAVAHALAQRGSHVTFVGLPYHPTTYQLLKAEPAVAANMSQLNGKLSTLAADNAFTYLDLRDPSTAGCTGLEFRDSHHSAPECSEKITNTLFAQGALSAP